jgi:hypothetical protein
MDASRVYFVADTTGSYSRFFDRAKKAIAPMLRKFDQIFLVPLSDGCGYSYCGVSNCTACKTVLQTSPIEATKDNLEDLLWQLYNGKPNGIDVPEAVTCALQVVVNHLGRTPHHGYTKVFLITDNPGHGYYHHGRDNYKDTGCVNPNYCGCGGDVIATAKKLSQRNATVTVLTTNRTWIGNCAYAVFMSTIAFFTHGDVFFLPDLDGQHITCDSKKDEMSNDQIILDSYLKVLEVEKTIHRGEVVVDLDTVLCPGQISMLGFKQSFSDRLLKENISRNYNRTILKEMSEETSILEKIWTTSAMIKPEQPKPVENDDIIKVFTTEFEQTQKNKFLQLQSEPKENKPLPASIITARARSDNRYRKRRIRNIPVTNLDQKYIEYRNKNKERLELELAQALAGLNLKDMNENIYRKREQKYKSDIAIYEKNMEFRMQQLTLEE